MLSNMKILLGLLLVITGLTFWVLQDNQETTINQPLIESWQKNDANLAAIDQVLLSQSGEQILLQKAGNQWVLNGGFYASIDPLFNLLQSFKNAEIVEVKTANPDKHGQVELSADDLKVEFHQNNTLVNAIHVGKKSSTGLTFVRHADEDQTYAVKGLGDITFNLDSWQLKTVIDLPGVEVQSIKINNAAGSVIDVSRDLTSGQLMLNNIPDGQQMKANAALDQLANGLSRLMIDGAVPLDLTEKDELLLADYGLMSGDEIKLKVYQQGDVYYLLIESALYPEYADWMMEIAAYKYEAFNRQMTDFVEPVVTQDGVDQPAQDEVSEVPTGE